MLDAIRGARIARTVKSSNYYVPFFQASLTLLRHYNVVYVENSKVGCTKIKKHLLEIDNYPRTWDKILEKEVHIHNKELTGMIGAADLTHDGLFQVMNSDHFYRFGFVRNPYGRLLSAFKDKILAPQKSADKKHYVGVACKIKSSFTGQYPETVNLDIDPVTFPEFVHFVTKQRPYDMDRHWFFQHSTMWYPFCKFDFIGRFENFRNDLHKVFETIGAPNSIIESIHEKDNPSPNIKKKFYDENLAEMVFIKFRRDFDIFDYSKTSWRDY